MKLGEAKVLFDAGALKSPVVTAAVMQAGWNVQAQANRGMWQTEALIAKSGRVREFKTVEAALAVLSDIGFKEAKITGIRD